MRDRQSSHLGDAIGLDSAAGHQALALYRLATGNHLDAAASFADRFHRIAKQQLGTAV